MARNLAVQAIARPNRAALSSAEMDTHPAGAPGPEELRLPADGSNPR